MSTERSTVAAMRVVSLVPSGTEILFAVGMGASVVARTHECDYPPEVRHLPAVTADVLPPGRSSAAIDEAVRAGLADRHTIYRLDADRLRELAPDVVVTQRTCPVCAVPAAAVDEVVCTMPRATRVVATNPRDLDGVWESIVDVAEAVDAGTQGASLVGRIRRRLSRLARLVAGRTRPRVAVVEWPDPPYAPGHWVPGMVSAAGGEPVFGEPGAPSRPAALAELREAKPDLIVLAFCGFDLLETQARMRELARHEGWIDVARGARVVAVDGSAYFSRPGPRLVEGIGLLAWAMHRPHPELQPHPGRGAELIEAGWVDLAALPVRTTASS